MLYVKMSGVFEAALKINREALALDVEGHPDCYCDERAALFSSSAGGP